MSSVQTSRIAPAGATEKNPQGAWATGSVRVFFFVKKKNRLNSSYSLSIL